MIILVATDFSPAANNAVDYAAHLAQTTDSELILFNVFKLNIHASNSLASTSSIDNLIRKSENELIRQSRDLQESHKIKVSWELKKDDTIGSLKQYMKTHWVDLVVMGIESNLIEYKLFGNTTTSAIHLMQFPLLVVPNEIPFAGINKIMLACDLSYLKEDFELGVLKQLTRCFKSQLQVFHVFTHRTEKQRDEELERFLEGVLHGIDHTYGYAYNHKVGDGIREGLDQFPADLLVMIPHKLRFFEYLLKGSKTDRMTVRTRTPLLVIPNERVM
ncbi:universal stress protein [Marinoscillum sp. MHG1-6]|uniref:universal stress protein n=1 Tax=Marinoscillum sp. MHG1-6 TaxID=2959627 RepID=UPI0021575B8D|nr:universal stress protein [Marinoscillum sp. MHG1-6]